ncbi:MAG: UDP-2,3-diacylglucosamine diphosphatase [Burkholderiaceae bacterium]
MLSGNGVGLFASDMHLGDHDPDTAAFFFEKLAAAWPRATQVFLLGDLFEAWVGDDQPDGIAAEALTQFARIAASGRRLWLMRGNRDFLLDTARDTPQGGFAERCGAVMLDDPCVFDLFGEPVVLTHGDALCTDDTDYQHLRTRLRSVQWQQAFLARPLPERLAFARAMRTESERYKAAAGAPADVAQTAVDALLRACGARTMIHGHTHRPACHRWSDAYGDACRWVLSDWDARDGRGGFLWATAEGLRAASV